MRFQCPHCKQHVEIDDELALLDPSCACPSCGENVQVAKEPDESGNRPRSVGKRSPWKKWRWRGSIARPSGAEFIASWLGTALLGGITYACFHFSPEMFRFWKGEWFLAIAWGLPIGSVVMFIRSSMRSARALRFRGARLRLLTHPGRIGGSFKAELVIRQVLPRGTVINANLVNQAVIKTHYPNSKGHTAITPIFETTCIAQIDDVPYRNGAYVIPLEYSVPSRAKDETDDTCTKTRTAAHLWRLQARATLQGTDMDLDFPVPVFHVNK